MDNVINFYEKYQTIVQIFLYILSVFGVRWIYTFLSSSPLEKHLFSKEKRLVHKFLESAVIAFGVELVIFLNVKVYGDIDNLDDTNNLTIALMVFAIIVSYHFIIEVMLIPSIKAIINGIKSFLRKQNIHWNIQGSKTFTRISLNITKKARKCNLRTKTQVCKIASLLFLAGYILLFGSYKKQKSFMELTINNYLSYIEAFITLYFFALFFVCIIRYIASTDLGINKSTSFYIMFNGKKFYILYPINKKELLLSEHINSENKSYIILNRQDLSGKEIIQEKLIRLKD